MPRFHTTIVAAILLLPIIPSATHAEKNLVRPPGTTRYQPMVARLKSMLAYDHAHGAGRMGLSSIGMSVKGRSLWMVTLRDPSVTAEQTKKVFYLCRQHGHEPASTEAALSFAAKLVKAGPDDPLADTLKHVTVYIVPMANPDGSEKFLRHNARDVDLNRDWLKRTQPETRAIYKTVFRLHPDLMTDQHELYPSDSRGDFTETVGPLGRAMPQVVDSCMGTQQIVQLSMASEGFHTRSCVIDDGHPARLAHRYENVKGGVPTILFETNRSNGGGRSVAARAEAHERFMTVILRDLAGERDQLLSEAEARGFTIPSGLAPQVPAVAGEEQLPASDETLAAPAPTMGDEGEREGP
ncbi:MAG: M14 family zinc carboxypeptidase [Capsulimonas sp.]|uniref:M14 family zinc carboxypeptidase n=1 Tax=Capsulimonas sp. TaxID=2494211 RepID=UPI0032652E17